MTADTRLANDVRSQPRKRINDFGIDAVLLAPGCGFLLFGDGRADRPASACQRRALRTGAHDRLHGRQLRENCR